MPASVDNFVTGVSASCAMRLRVAAVAAMAVVAAATAGAEELNLPPIGFFEYLGSMVEHEGELIDPLSLQAMMTVEQTAEAEPSVEEHPPGWPGTANNAEEVQ